MQFQEGQTVGIDLGTTFSTIAQLDEDGNPVPLPNEEEEVETPSLVLLAEGGHVIVGPSRMRAAMEDPEHVVERIKREMGNADYQRTFDGRPITPEFLSALILKKLRQDAEKRIGKIGNSGVNVSGLTALDRVVQGPLTVSADSNTAWPMSQVRVNWPAE